LNLRAGVMRHTALPAVGPSGRYQFARFTWQDPIRSFRPEVALTLDSHSLVRKQRT
jgi:hypothetical protein